MKFNIATNDGVQTSVTAFIGGRPFTATKEHPSFKKLVSLLKELRLRGGGAASDEVQVKGLFDIGVGISEGLNQYEHLSDRVSVGGGQLLLDGDPFPGVLADAILRYHAAGLPDWGPLVSFLEKLATNPNPHSQEHLFRFMQQHDFVLHPDGDLITYKSVNNDLLSGHSGEAWVNGTRIVGRIPCQPGTIIEMPRSKVRFDPAVGCSTGLHVGNWSFARAHINGGTMLRMKVNPRDVVSVPVEGEDQKMRVCRYQVLDVVTSAATDVVQVTDARIARATHEAEVSAEKLGNAPGSPVKLEAPPFPRFYEDFKRANFEACTAKELRWLVAPEQWNCAEGDRWKATKADLVEWCLTSAQRNRKNSKARRREPLVRP